jgi:Siphovirus Gp157
MNAYRRYAMNKLGEVYVYNALRSRIKDEYNLYDDDQCLLDTLNGETSLQESIISIARDIKRIEGVASSLRTIITDNNTRLRRLEKKAEGLRASVAWALQETDLKKVDGPDVTVSQRDGGRQLLITDESMIPLHYCEVKYSPSKTKIREGMDGGQDVPGAAWSNPQPTLTIRTK